MILLAGCLGPLAASAQIDPYPRELIQLGYNASFQGIPPLAAYAFYYRNVPNFLQTNLTLRLAVAPVYLDSELGISHVLDENTDLGVGLAGGAFADSYDEIRCGQFYRSESFTGYGGENSVSLYYCFNPRHQNPFNGGLRGIVHYSTYDRNSTTDPEFQLPRDRTTFSVRTGLRWGGIEPTLFPALAMELSVWYEGQFRTAPGAYGFGGDRELESASHLFWASAAISYTLPGSQQNFFARLIAGTSMDADRF